MKTIEYEKKKCRKQQQQKNCKNSGAAYLVALNPFFICSAVTYKHYCAPMFTFFFFFDKSKAGG